MSSHITEQRAAVHLPDHLVLVARPSLHNLNVGGAISGIRLQNQGDRLGQGGIAMGKGDLFLGSI